MISTLVLTLYITLTIGIFFTYLTINQLFTLRDSVGLGFNHPTSRAPLFLYPPHARIKF